MRTFTIAQIQDGDIRIIGPSGDTLEVDSSGKIGVNTAPTIPATKTHYEILQDSLANSNGGISNSDHVLPVGENIILNSFSFGGMLNNNKILYARCDLYWQPNGSNIGEELIGTLFIGGNPQASLDFVERSFVGDGTARFRFEVVNESAGLLDYVSTIRGYY